MSGRDKKTKQKLHIWQLTPVYKHGQTHTGILFI